MLASVLLLVMGCDRLATSPGEDGSAAASAAVAEIQVHPEDFAVQVGESLDFEFEVLAQDGSTLDRTVQWSSRDTTVATVDANGHLVARGEGEVQVVASAEEVTDEARGEVVPPGFSVKVAPSYWSLQVGQRKTFTATVKDSSGTTVDRHTVWSSTDTHVATVDSVGRVTARNSGSAGIVAQAAGTADTAVLSVSGSSVPMPSSLAVEEQSRSDDQVQFEARWSRVQAADAYSWHTGSNSGRWKGSGSTSDTTTTFTAPRSGTDDDSYFCVRAVDGDGQSEQRCDGYTVVANTSDTTDTTEPSGSSDAVVVFDPDQYSSQQELEDGAHGVFDVSQDLNSGNGGSIHLDKNVGYPGGSQSMRYDYVDQGVGTSINLGRRIPIPSAKEVWVEFYVRWSDNFFDIENFPTDGSETYAHKLLFGEAKALATSPSWETSEGYSVQRWALYFPSGGNQNPPNGRIRGEPPVLQNGSHIEEGGATSTNVAGYFDGQWHKVRLHFRHDPGLYELWIDGVKILDWSFADVHDEVDITAILLGRNKDDGIESGTESLWWGRMSIWLESPGW